MARVSAGASETRKGSGGRPWAARTALASRHVRALSGARRETSPSGSGAACRKPRRATAERAAIGTQARPTGTLYPRVRIASAAVPNDSSSRTSVSPETTRPQGNGATATVTRRRTKAGRDSGSERSHRNARATVALDS